MGLKSLLRDKAFLWLVVLTLLSGLFAFELKDSNSFWSGFFSNIAAGFVTAIIFWIIIDKTIQFSEDLKRRRAEKAALVSFHFPLMDLQYLFWNMRRATTIQSFIVDNLRDAIATDSAIADMLLLDFYSDAGVFPHRDWFVHFAEKFDEFIKSTERVLSYSPYLSIEFIENLEAITSSDLFRMLRQSRLTSQLHDQLRPTAPKHMALLYSTVSREYLKKVISCLVSLIDEYNKQSERKILFKGNSDENTAPPKRGWAPT